MKKFVKPLIIIVAIISIIFVICGIGVILFILGIVKDFTTPAEIPNAYEEGIIPTREVQMEQYAEALMEHLKTGDFSDGKVQKMFCEDTLSKYDVTKQLTEASEFIEGNIVSYDEPRGRGNGKSVEYGVTLYHESLCDINNVITDTGKKYDITIRGYFIMGRHPEREGVMDIMIRNLDTPYTDMYGKKEFVIFYVGKYKNVGD